MNKEAYFEYNGVRYYSGTKFTMKEPKYGQVVEAVFWNSFENNGMKIDVMYKHYNFKGRVCEYHLHINAEDVGSKVIDILEGNYFTELEAKKKYIKDSDIPELFFGWIFYLIIMVVLIIFKDMWLGWIAASAYFFWWRKKIKEENYYYE